MPFFVHDNVIYKDVVQEREYDPMDGRGTTPGSEEIELRRGQQSRAESGIEAKGRKLCSSWYGATIRRRRALL